MKKYILLHLLILLASCATNLKVKQKENTVLENQLNSLEYKLVLPENWHSFLDIHREIGYKPIGQNSKYPDIQIQVRTIPKTKDTNLTLSEVVAKESTNKRFVTDYFREETIIETKFGKTYIVDEKFNMNLKYHIIRHMYFEYNLSFYSYSYYANSASFNKYIDDYGVMFESLKFN
ncbi:hypothetical protein [Polaribacter glomeratus]|uniref:PsbP C-terminal domain-containing protein n=1 Tax=Polaribacter glomeratus TaxID=102 RepID=A0A2S7WUN1_9FLAO|nr:hypothetical protein [Polaribacter glomeratus]PQJ81287.1 hypothetical protein BTO16_01245 [Polaribacter glomeratus]TXD65842.1 hypothetical protein ESX12_09510 [Polaribacter glomeratus]